MVFLFFLRFKKNSSDFSPLGEISKKSLCSFSLVSLTERVSGDFLIWKCILCSWWGVIQSKSRGKNGLPDRALLLVVLFQKLPCWLKEGLCLAGLVANSMGLLEIIRGFPLSVQSEGTSGFEVRLTLLNLPSLPTAVPVIWKKVSSFLATFDAETACIAHSFLHL